MVLSFDANAIGMKRVRDAQVDGMHSSLTPFAILPVPSQNSPTCWHNCARRYEGAGSDNRSLFDLHR